MSIVIAEGSETPGGQGTQPGGRAGPDTEGGGLGPEGDLLAERRARRTGAAQSPEGRAGDAALIRRAETAEATVRTLETHVASLQQRVKDAEEEARRTSEALAAEQAAAEDDLSPELRRAKQREYAEQQLRVEAEDRCIDLERESRVEIERLSRRLGASEHRARELAAQLETVQRELAEAQQAAATELATMRRAEHELVSRLTELEHRALEIQRGLGAERAARERAEREVEGLRLGHRRMEELIVELRGVVARLRAAAATAPEREGPEPLRTDASPDRDVQERATASAGGARGEARRDEMADALASAVARLRARVEDAGDVQADLPDRRGEPSTAPPPAPGPPPPRPAPHKHSMSLLTRLRLRRKHRRARRAAAAEPPSMQSQ